MNSVGRSLSSGGTAKLPETNESLVEEKSIREKHRRKAETRYSIALALCFATVGFAISTYFLLVSPRRLIKSSQKKYATNCERTHDFTMGYISDTLSLGAILFKGVLEQKLTTRGSPDEYMYPTSPEAARELIDLPNPAAWLHQELMRKVRRVKPDASDEGFNTRLLVAPLTRNKTRWEKAWSKIGPLVYPNATCCDVRDFDLLDDAPYLEWKSSSTDRGGFYAPWSYGWSHVGGHYGIRSSVDFYFGGNSLAVFDEFLDRRSELIELGFSTFTMRRVSSVSFGVAAFYPIKDEGETVALGILYCTNIQQLLESIVHDEERLKLKFDGVVAVGKGPSFKAKKVTEKHEVKDILVMGPPSPREAEIVLECSTSNDSIARNVMFARIACATTMALSVFFFIVFSYQHLREMRKVGEINDLERASLARAVSELTIRSEDHFINHEIKNRLIIMLGVFDVDGTDSSKTRQHVNELAKDSLALIRKREMIEALHTGIYEIDANYVSVADFLPSFAETYKLVHDGRPLVYSVTLPSEPTTYRIDESLLRISLDSMTNCVARYGETNGVISCSIVAEDATVIKLSVEMAPGAHHRRFLESCGVGTDADTAAPPTRDVDCSAVEPFVSVDDAMTLRAIEAGVMSEGAPAVRKLKFSVTPTVLRIEMSFNAIQAKVTPPTSERSSSSTTGGDIGLPPGKIFVLDDSAVILRMLKLKLEKEFPQRSVETFASPIGFVEAVLAPGIDKVVLCLLDENLGPGVECGTSVTRRLLSFGYRGLLISISANTSASDLACYRRAGMHGHCDKGGNAASLKSKILDIAETVSATRAAQKKSPDSSPHTFSNQPRLSDVEDPDEAKEEKSTSISTISTIRTASIIAT